MICTNQSRVVDLVTIIRLAEDEITALASETGIDASAFLANLPVPGQLITGKKVPVLHKKYRGTCSILYHLNQTASGQSWPYFRFHTFKNGGVSCEFNGLTWLKKHNKLPLVTKPAAIPVVEKQQTKEKLKEIALQEDKQREARFLLLKKQYSAAHQIDENASWLAKRLCGYASSVLLNRIAMRSCQNKLLLPLLHDSKGMTGFHQIKITENGDEKRHFIRKSGYLKGSYVLLKKVNAGPVMPVAICEGVATGLSIALVWPGEIRIALTAANIAGVRKTIPGKAVFFADQDIWKPDVGNVGKQAAIKAFCDGDLIASPRFSCQSYGRKPTDFNDLLMIDGFEVLNEQIFTVLQQFI